MTPLTNSGYYWVNIPNEYGWEIILVINKDKQLRCLRLGRERILDIPDNITEYRGPINPLIEP